MELLFVGTGAGDYESPFQCDCPNCSAIRIRGARNIRHYASALIDGRILLDCGPTVPWRLAELDVPPAQVQALFITHSHYDHVDAGAVQDLLTARGAEAAPLPVYGNGPSLAVLGELGDRLELVELAPGRKVDVLGRAFLPVRANHDLEHEETLNYLIGTSRGWVLYATDTAWPLDETWEALRANGLAGAVVEATFGLFGADQPDCLTHHLDWPAFLRLRDELVAHAILPPDAPYLSTHMSQHFAPIHDELSQQAVPPVVVGHDGLRVTL